jgi:tetratricopeptide (TPR) repeat protein
MIKRAGRLCYPPDMRRLTGLLLFWVLGQAQLGGQTLLALPFFNASGNKEIDWVGESFAESVFESLAARGRLLVSRDSRDGTLKEMNIRRYAPLTKASVIEIAVNLSADVVVYGQWDVVRDPAGGSKGQLRAAAQILYLNPMRNGPELRESGPFEDLSNLQNKLTQRILSSLDGAAAAPEESLPSSRQSVRLDALESYVRGLLASSTEQKIRLFGNAARIEPGFSQPCFQLGRIYAARKDWKAAAEWLARVGPGDSGYREALFRLSLARHHRGEYAAAAASLAKLAEMVPLGEVLNNLGAAQVRAGNPAAVESFQKAVDADPSDSIYQFNLGYALWRRGEFDAAAANFKAVLEQDPDDESAALLQERCQKRQGPRTGDPRTEGLERLKDNFDETAWLHLKAMLERKAARPD